MRLEVWISKKEIKQAGHIDIDDLDMTVLELKKILSAKHNIPAHLINISLGGILFQDRRKLGYYPLTEDDSIYIQIKKVRKVLRAPNWATTTRHDHRTLAEVMAMQDEEEDKGEKGYEDEEGYDYSRDSFPYAIHGVYYEMVEAGDHPVRPLARAAEPGKPVWSEKTGFWTRLRILLRKHYNKEATEKIVECFKQELWRYVSGINLDTVECMAEECLKLQSQ